ncbi:MAG TPA: 3-dehydroquinate synthase [Gemmatimonadota bacterium]|nr:3-dehydroquinate synthase [Gemmatimonadota bacterium]
MLRVHVPGAPERDYPVRVGRGLLDRLGALVSEAAPAHRYVVIADAEVAALYGARAGAALAAAGLHSDLLTFPAGERHKSRSTWAELTDQMLVAGVGRDAAVVALGGGVTGDLAGFTAATYMRGLPFVVVPTSLLAMLDSAVGGKTGLDTPAGKNTVGAFHHPRAVIADPDLLVTLPAAQLRAGLAEGVKAAAIADAELFTWIEEQAVALRDGEISTLERLVMSCLRIKAKVVAADPEEAGRREVLNFGHTAGHALEALAGLALPHGEAVAAGMRIEARLGEGAGVTEQGTVARLAAVLDACGLPDAVHAPGASARFSGPLTADRLLAAAAADKKARRGAVRWVLLRRIGEVARTSDGGWAHRLGGEELSARLAAALRAASDVRDFAS